MPNITLTNLQRLWESKKGQLGLSQIRVAETLNISQPALSQYLAGKIPLNTDFILQMAHILRVNPMDIDPSLQQIFLPQLRRVKIKMVNSDSFLETFSSSTTCLGFKIPNNTYAPRFQENDAIIFLPLTLPQTQLHVLAYNAEAFFIGTITSVNDLEIVLDYAVTLPRNQFQFGIIESIVPSAS